MGAYSIESMVLATEGVPQPHRDYSVEENEDKWARNGHSVG